MPRKVRQILDGGIYHVFNRGNNRMDLFQGPSDYLFFLKCLRTAKLKLSFDLFHYCLMPNHFHLLMQIQHAQDISSAMQEIQLSYVRYFKKRYEFVGHVFQERFRSPLISEDSYYLQCGRYIERNPVKAGMVDAAEDYAYSSAAYYVKGHQDPLITPNPYYLDLHPEAKARQEAYRSFLSLGEPYQDGIDKLLLIA